MNDTTGDRILAESRKLFATNGFDGTSVRAITAAARANLGAVTYHFGSKAALYEAVVASMADPFRERVAAAGDGAGAPLERIERVVRAFFAHLREHPELPRLVLHQIASQHPMPAAARRALQSNHGTLARLIAAGQRDGSIRPGDPRLMALNIAAQPMLLTLMRRVLQEAVAIDQADPETSERLVENAVAFVRAGLAAQGGSPS